MRAVNLLPHEDVSARSLGVRDPLVAGGALVTAVVLAGVGGVFLLEHSQAGTAQQQLSIAQAQLAEAQGHARHVQSKQHAKPVLPTPSVTAQEQPWRTAVASAMSTRIAFDRVLAEFERVVPSDVTVSNLAMDAPGSSGTTTTSTATANGTFTLTGSTFSEDSVARLMSRLMLLPDLTGVSLSSSVADPSTGVVTFTVLAQVKGAASSTSTTTTTTATTAGATA